jgi:hypothetical protein
MMPYVFMRYVRTRSLRRYPSLDPAASYRSSFPRESTSPELPPGPAGSCVGYAEGSLIWLSRTVGCRCICEDLTRFFLRNGFEFN